MKDTSLRPYVLMNLAMSADGKITTRRRERIILGSKNDRLMMDTLRACVDAVIIGARTLKIDGHPLIVRDRNIRRRRVDRGLSPHPINVLLSRRLGIPIQREFFRYPDTVKILYTTHDAEQRKRKRFEKYADVVVLPRGNMFLDKVLADLLGRGVDKVLVEGGGELNFSFFQKGYVDELYLTVTPRIIGGTEAPTVADGKGFLKNSHAKLELLSAKRKGQEVFLRYRVKTA